MGNPGQFLMNVSEIYWKIRKCTFKNLFSITDYTKTASWKGLMSFGLLLNFGQWSAGGLCCFFSTCSCWECPYRKIEMWRSEMQRKASQMFQIRDWDPGWFASSFIRFQLLLESSLRVLRGMVCSLMSLPLIHGNVRGNYRNIKSEKFGFRDL